MTPIRWLVAFAGLATVSLFALVGIQDLRGRTVTELEGVYRGQHWFLRSSGGSTECFELWVEGRLSTAACGFTGLERVGGGPGPAGSEALFGPVPRDTARVRTEAIAGTPLEVSVLHRKGLLRGDPYFFLLVPPGVQTGRTTYVDRDGHDIE